MRLLEFLMEVIKQQAHPSPAGATGAGQDWGGETPSMIPPGSALSPWIHLQQAQSVRFRPRSRPGLPGLRGSPLAVGTGPFTAAMAQVRSVGTVEKIDSYFQKYQMGHYQANPVRPNHTPPPGSTIAIVRTDGQDSGIEDLADAATPMKAQRQQYNKKVLSEQELMVYKHALLCAQFPVLGSKTSSSSALPSPTARGGAIGGVGVGVGSSLLSSPPPSPGALSLEGGGVGDEDDSMVQEETLCVLVKEAFGLSEERHLFYDDHITRGLGNKPPAKLLVEELMGRLSLLQTNSHPYYQPQAFETRNAYDLWQQQEGQQISALINRFWRGPLPNLDPLVCRASYWSSMHDMYRDMMVLLIKHDKVLKAGPITGCPLLSSSRRLLREFSLHYGVGEVFRRVAYLEYLSCKDTFDSEDWFLKHISQTLLGVQDLLTKHQARVIMVRKEYELLSRALSQLQERCCDKLERLLQERSPQTAVVSVITNLSDILQLTATLFGQRHGDLETIITQSLKESIQNSYNGQKLRLTTELRLNAYSSPVSAELVSKLILHIQSEIQHCQENYQKLFQLYHVEIMESAASTFYACLMADVSVLCDRTQVAPHGNEQRRDYIDPEMIAMARRLDRLDYAWKDYIPTAAQEWRRSLTRSAVNWFQYLIRDMQAMILYSIIRDKFEAVHLTFSEDKDGAQSSYSGSHRPSNANPLTQSVGSAFASVVPKDQAQESPSNNNSLIKPHPKNVDQSGISFNPSGILNFNRPVRTRSFPQLRDLIDRTEQWSVVSESRDRDGSFGPSGGADQQGLSEVKPRVPGGDGGGFQPVESRERDGSVTRSRASGHDLSHSQSYPELATAATSSSSIRMGRAASRAASGHGWTASHTHNDLTSSGKDQSTESTGRSRTDSGSQPHSDPTFSSDAENSTDTGSVSRGGRHHGRKRKEPLRAVFEQLGLFSGDGLDQQQQQQSEVMLPVSCSLVDMVYIVRHTCGLMLDICSVLKPEILSMSSEVRGQEPQGQLATDLQQLMISPLQAVTFAVRLFGSNMLATDMCATPVREVNQMVSKEILNRVFIFQNAGLLATCRHERSGQLDCNLYFNRDSPCLCDNFEPINPEMCLRINNIHGMLELLPDLVLVTDEDVNGGTGPSPGGDGGGGSRVYRPLQKYLQGLMLGQIKLLAFKVNLMLKRALEVLLQLDLGVSPYYSIADRLRPLVRSIHNHLVATSSWLYHRAFQLFCQELWKCIVKNFEGLVEELLMEKTENRGRSMLLLQAIAHLMATVNNHEEHGLNADVFLEPAEGVIQILQLYTWPTKRLIKLYQGLLQKAWEGTSAESWPMRRETLKILQRLLCQQKKCFSGDELIQALVQCQDEESRPDNIWEWAYHTAEELLTCGLVRRMMASGHTVHLNSFTDGAHHHHGDLGEVSDLEGYSFPEVTLHSIPRTSRKPTFHSDGTTTAEDTDAMSDDPRGVKPTALFGSRLYKREDSKSSSDGEEDLSRTPPPVEFVEVVADVHRRLSSSSSSVIGTVVSGGEVVVTAETGMMESVVESHPKLEGGEVGHLPSPVSEGDDASKPATREQVIPEIRIQECFPPQSEHGEDDVMDEAGGVEEENTDAPLPGAGPEDDATGAHPSITTDQVEDLEGLGSQDIVVEEVVPEAPHEVASAHVETSDSTESKLSSHDEVEAECVNVGTNVTSSKESALDSPGVEEVGESDIPKGKPDEKTGERTEDLASTSEAVMESSEAPIMEATSDGEESITQDHEKRITDSDLALDQMDSRDTPKVPSCRAIEDDSSMDVGLAKEQVVRPKVKSDPVEDQNMDGIQTRSHRTPSIAVQAQAGIAGWNLMRRQSTFSDTSMSDDDPSSFSDDYNDTEGSATPRVRSPVTSRSRARPAVTPAFSADAHQLYCFSQVYDPIPEEEELEESHSHLKSTTYQRMLENLDITCSPELVIAIISTRNDKSAKAFTNQVGDETLLMREASCIKRLCRACFNFR